MKKSSIVFAILCCGLFSCTYAPKESADTIYTNGKIYTVNETQPWAEAVAIKDGKLIKVGSTTDVEKLTSENTEVIDLAGKFVMPGLVDTHTHPFVSSFDMLDNFTLDPVPESLEDIQNQVRAYINANPDTEWVLGAAWPKGLFPMENAMREWLDEVSTEIPITLLDQGGHAFWNNTIALEKGGMMDPDFKAPKFGVVERDEKGVPTGTIRDASMGRLRQVMPKASADQYLKAALFTQEVFNEKGVTAHRTAQGNENGLSSLKQLTKENKLSLHWAVSLDVNFFDSPYSFEERMEQIGNRKQFASEFVGTDFAKIFVDGDLNGYGIKMKKPFEGTTDEYGSLQIEPDELTRLVKLLDKQEISIQFHAIGSQSIEHVVEALEAASESNGGQLNVRHYPDHLGFISLDQINRLVKVNGLIGFAPYFAFTFPGIHESYTQYVGKERLSNMQPIRTALDAGATIGTGTDWSSLPQDPWPLIEGMTNRKNPWDANSEANNASESITLAEAIHVYTLGGAHALLKEDKIGSLEVGKYADFIILNQNLFEISPDDIDQTKVLNTIFNGKEVFAAAAE